MTVCMKQAKYDSLFDGMHQYMFSAENILRVGSGNDSQQTAQQVRSKRLRTSASKTTTNSSRIASISPRQHDTLFWCFFIINRGTEEYELCKSTPFKTEKEFKIGSVELLRDNADRLKGMKLRAADIESELVNDTKITLSGLRALSMVHGTSVFYVSGLTYYEFEYAEGGEAPRGVIVYDKTTKKASVRNGLDNESYMDEIKKSHFNITNPEKPMNAISGYTLPVLQKICVKLSIPTVRADGRKETKKTLYEAILYSICG